MSWEFTAFDMIWVKNTIQKELGIQWTSIPIELSLWIKKTQRKSCNTWQLLSFRKGYQGILLNDDPNKVTKLSKDLKTSFTNDGIEDAFKDELRFILERFKESELSSDLTDFYVLNSKVENPNKKISVKFFVIN